MYICTDTHTYIYAHTHTQTQIPWVNVQEGRRRKTSTWRNTCPKAEFLSH